MVTKVKGATASNASEVDMLSGEAVEDAVNARIIFKTGIAELEALVGSTGDVVNLSLPMRGGEFVWRSGDQSAKVTSDPFQGIWIAGAGDATGASGAWMRRYFGPINDRRIVTGKRKINDISSGAY